MPLREFEYMVFSSATFLCLFFPIVFLLHTLVKHQRARNAVLLAASLFFYAWGEPRLIVSMLLVTAVNYLCALSLDRAKTPVRRKLYFIIGVCAGLAALVYYKYSAFLINSFASLFGLTYRMTPLKLPIGISFYTFQLITYTADVYRRDIPVQKNFFRLLLYVSLFPQLIAGPIVRYADVAERIEHRKVTPKGIGEGFFRFTLGLGKKVVLANKCGEILSSLPAPGSMTFFSGWLAAILFLLQLYFDFAGYSDMAIGIGRMLGFRFRENFDAPFVSADVSEFWRRWHISLGAFFREYVYIPLGGNRVSRLKWLRNMLCVWALTGIWHGASWCFVCWGLWFGLFIILEKTLLKGILAHIPKFLRHFFTVIIAITGFVFFNNETFPAVFAQLGAMFAPWKAGWSDAYAVFAFKDNALFLLLCVFASLPVRKTVVRWWNRRKRAGKRNVLRPYLKAVLCCLLLAVSLMLLAGQSYNPFLYFRF